jgi:hypothetical protein
VHPNSPAHIFECEEFGGSFCSQQALGQHLNSVRSLFEQHLNSRHDFKMRFFSYELGSLSDNRYNGRRMQEEIQSVQWKVQYQDVDIICNIDSQIQCL